MGYNRPRYVTLNVLSTATSPLDSTSYYFGGQPTAWTTTAETQHFTSPVSGVVREVSVNWNTQGAASSAEDVLMELRVQGTSYTIATVSTNQGLKNFYNANVNAAVTAGNKVEIKVTTPAWVTNPTNVFISGIICIETP